VKAARVAALLLVSTLVGCAGMSQKAGKAGETDPYAGVFTGEYVEGLPLYRLPSIRVVGSRRAADDL
jgi:hypothetical protein